MLLAALTVWWLIPPWHPEFGVLHHAGVVHYYFERERLLAKAAVWVDDHSPLRINLCRHVDCSPRPPRWDDCLALGTNQLYWSLNDPRARTGWLSFSRVQAFSTNGIWEFAPCALTNLMAATQAALRASFVGMGDARGPAVFGTNWAGSAIRVAQGQVVLARRVGQQDPVYVMLLKHQTGGMKGPVKLEIDYLSAREQQAANIRLEPPRLALPVYPYTNSRAAQTQRFRQR